jgi:Dolichyl-phosphate-mannose-protein mannosyltransferase
MRHRVLAGLTVGTAIGIAAWCLLPDSIIAVNTDPDEGVYLMVARLLRRGFDTRPFFFDQFWLFPKIITAAFAMFGDSLIVARLTVFAFSLAGLLGIAVLSYQLGARWLAATAAILIGAIDPLYIRGSRMTLADVPAMTCIVWALVFIFLFVKDRRRIWIVLSGFFTAISLILKPFALGFAVTILVVLLNQRIHRASGRLKIDPAILGDLFAFGAVALLTAAPFVNFLHPVQEYHRVLGFHLAERDWMIKREDDRWEALLAFARFNLPVLSFAVVGLISWRPLSFSLVALLTGEILTTLILLQMPPWIHHYILVIPPLIVFAALGFTRGSVALKTLFINLRHRQRPQNSAKWIGLGSILAILITVVDVPWLIKYDRRARYPEPLHVESVVKYAEQEFQPNEYLISDDAMVPYLAGRLIPPSSINFVFGDVMKFDRPSLHRFEKLARANHVAGVITTTRYPRNPQLMSWIAETFPVSAQVGMNHPDELTARIYSADKPSR